MPFRQVSGAADLDPSCILHCPVPTNRFPNQVQSIAHVRSCDGSYVCPDESPLRWIPRLSPLRYTERPGAGQASPG